MQGEPIIDYLKRRLNTDYRRKQSALAGDLKIGQSTISRIARGEISPTLEVVQPLLDRIAADDAKAKRASARKPKVKAA